MKYPDFHPDQHRRVTTLLLVVLFLLLGTLALFLSDLIGRVF